MTQSMNWVSIQWHIILFELLNLWIGYLWNHLSLSLKSVDKMKINLCVQELVDINCSSFSQKSTLQNLGVTFHSYLTFQPHIKAIKTFFHSDLWFPVKASADLFFCLSLFKSYMDYHHFIYLTFKNNINHHTPSGLIILVYLANPHE